MAFVNQQKANFFSNLIGTFIKGLHQRNGNLFTDAFLAAADKSDISGFDTDKRSDTLNPLGGEFFGVNDDQRRLSPLCEGGTRYSAPGDPFLSFATNHLKVSFSISAPRTCG